MSTSAKLMSNLGLRLPTFGFHKKTHATVIFQLFSVIFQLFSVIFSCFQLFSCA